MRAVRAHGILCDDLGVYREGRGHDFSGVDRVYDELMDIGLRPVVELSFMPRDLARDPGQTVFSYDAIISPPKDWHRWADLAGALAAHLVQRYGADEVADHWAFDFEELGAPPELFHGGFGLLSVGNLRKPRYWALALLAGMGRHRLPVSVTGDGAGGLVEALAARHDDGRIGILAWNLTLDQGKIGGDPRLDRLVRLQVAVPAPAGYRVRHYRIDAGHSNIAAAWEQMRHGASWPQDGQWPRLRALNTLEELWPPARVAARAGEPLEFSFDLPMPGVSYLELAP